MSDALFITLGAIGIVGVIVAVVTWMLVSPARAHRRQPRVLPQGEVPLARAALYAEAEATPREAPACSEPEAPEQSALRERLRAAEEALGVAEAGSTEGAAAADEARRVAEVLWRLGAREPEVEARAGDPVITPEALSPIPDERWIADVAAPGLERCLTGIVALLGPEVITWDAHPATRYGLHRGERVESLPSPPRLCALATGVARAVGVPPPVFFVTPGREARLVHVNLAVAGRFAAGLAVGKEGLAVEDEAVMRFMLGRKLTFMRPEHLLCTAVESPEGLRALHLAAAYVLDPGTLPEPPAVVAGLAREEALARLRGHFGEAEVALVMRRLLRAARDPSVPGDPADPDRWERWLVASAETSFRCGLLLCGSLRAAIAILDLDGVIPGTHREHAQCYQALYRFYLSGAYATLRRDLTG